MKLLVFFVFYDIFTIDRNDCQTAKLAKN